ncbi:hypothetical protein GVAV_002901 [Gurleya vavrai]
MLLCFYFELFRCSFIWNKINYFTSKTTIVSLDIKSEETKQNFESKNHIKSMISDVINNKDRKTLECLSALIDEYLENTKDKIKDHILLLRNQVNEKLEAACNKEIQYFDKNFRKQELADLEELKSIVILKTKLCQKIVLNIKNNNCINEFFEINNNNLHLYIFQILIDIIINKDKNVIINEQILSALKKTENVMSYILDQFNKNSKLKKIIVDKIFEHSKIFNVVLSSTENVSSAKKVNETQKKELKFKRPESFDGIIKKVCDDLKKSFLTYLSQIQTITIDKNCEIVITTDIKYTNDDQFIYYITNDSIKDDFIDNLFNFFKNLITKYLDEIWNNYEKRIWPKEDYVLDFDFSKYFYEHFNVFSSIIFNIQYQFKNYINVVEGLEQLKRNFTFFNTAIQHKLIDIFILETLILEKFILNDILISYSISGDKTKEKYDWLFKTKDEMDFLLYNKNKRYIFYKYNLEITIKDQEEKITKINVKILKDNKQEILKIIENKLKKCANPNKEFLKDETIELGYEFPYNLKENLIKIIDNTIILNSSYTVNEIYALVEKKVLGLVVDQGTESSCTFQSFDKKTPERIGLLFCEITKDFIRKIDFETPILQKIQDDFIFLEKMHRSYNINLISAVNKQEIVKNIIFCYINLKNNFTEKQKSKGKTIVNDKCQKNLEKEENEKKRYNNFISKCHNLRYDLFNYTKNYKKIYSEYEDFQHNICDEHFLKFYAFNFYKPFEDFLIENFLLLFQEINSKKTSMDRLIYFKDNFDCFLLLRILIHKDTIELVEFLEGLAKKIKK